MSPDQWAVTLIVLGAIGLSWSSFKLGQIYGRHKEAEGFRQYQESRLRAERKR